MVTPIPQIHLSDNQTSSELNLLLMASTLATSFASQLLPRASPKGLPLLRPTVAPVSVAVRVRASRPLSTVAAVKSNSNPPSTTRSPNKSSKAAEEEEAVEEVKEDLPWIQEKALDLVEFTGSVTQAIPGPEMAPAPSLGFWLFLSLMPVSILSSPLSRPSKSSLPLDINARNWSIKMLCYANQ